MTEARLEMARGGMYRHSLNDNQKSEVWINVLIQLVNEHKQTVNGLIFNYLKYHLD